MVIKDAETRDNILDGAKLLHDFVKTTMGPKGRNVIIRDKFGGLSVTHDGVTAAKAVSSDNLQEQIGIELIRKASEQMDYIGDGTTSVTVLAYNLIKELNTLIEEGMNPMVIKRELEPIVTYLIDSIQAKSTLIKQTPQAVFDVANISAANPVIAKMIAELVVGTGYKGAITVETVSGGETYSELTAGYRFMSGYTSPYFVTDNISREAVLNNLAVILVNGNMDDMEQYQDVIIDLTQDKKITDILFIVNGIDNEMQSIMVLNHVKKAFRTAVVKNYFGQEYLDDIAAFTGAKVFNPLTGDNLTIEAVGKAQKAVINAAETIIFGGFGSTEAQIEALTRKQPTPDIKRRLEALNGKIGLIKVGGVNDTEAEELKYRIDDAVAATRAALEGGILAGGGVTLRNIAMSVLPSKVGDAVVNALMSLEHTLIENSGYDYGDFIGKKAANKWGYGMDVHTGKIVNMLKSGIVDPTIVTVEVVRNAFAVAATAITIGGASIAEPISQEELARLMDLVKK